MILALSAVALIALRWVIKDLHREVHLYAERERQYRKAIRELIDLLRG